MKQKTLKFFTARRKAPKITIIIPIIIYILFYYCTVFTSDSKDSVEIGNSVLQISSFTGVFSMLSSICLILMVLYYKKLGFIVSLSLVLLQLPRLIMIIAIQYNPIGVSGIFTSVFTILMLVLIQKNQTRAEKDKKQMKLLFEQTATALADTIDTKDTYTHGHSTRVAEYSRKLAELNGKSEQECDEVYYTALLHDVGKIGVPISIINKPGKLTDKEYEIIKQHTAKGAQILGRISKFPYLSLGAYYHHERCDGKGYPKGLNGEEIPEIARIIGVADAYDAMTSIRSYRDPIPQDKVREEIVTGMGTQFDPKYARLMIHMIDIDSEYEMKERAENCEQESNNALTVTEHRSSSAGGILLDKFMTTIDLAVTVNDKASQDKFSPSMILFDSLDGQVHEKEKEVRYLMYFEYAELGFDGQVSQSGARKIQVKTEKATNSSIKKSSDYRIEAVRINDHALIRVSGKERTTEFTVALPDSSRYLYIGLTGTNCRFTSISSNKADKECPDDFIPRIAEKISYIDAPSGDLPNVQIDSYRSSASEGVEIRDGMRISFHTRSLPTARLVWHCPYVDIFSSDDGKVGGENYRDLAFTRFDGECWELDPKCDVVFKVFKNDSFEDWDSWKKLNHDGYDAEVTFKVDGNRITLITENGGITVYSTAVVYGASKKIYAAITGDQVAITNLRIG